MPGICFGECFVRSNAHAMGKWHEAFVFTVWCSGVWPNRGHVFKRAAMMRLVVTHTDEFKENRHDGPNRKNGLQCF